MSLTRTTRFLVVAAAAAVGAAASIVVAAPASAVPGLIVAIDWSDLTGTETFKTADAVCPAGTVLLGGGADVVDSAHTARLSSMVPSPLGYPTNSFYSTALRDVGAPLVNWTMYTWAICGSGVTGWEVVTASATGVHGGTLTAVTANCPAGKKVIGSGGGQSGGSAFVLDTVQPVSNLSGVYVEVAASEYATPDYSWGARAYAICINPVPGQQLVSATTTSSSSTGKFTSVKCPAGTQLHGTGGSLTGAIGQAGMDRVGLFGSGAVAGADIEAYEDTTGFAGNWTATAFAICAN